jgi:hypothetical protein
MSYAVRNQNILARIDRHEHPDTAKLRAAAQRCLDVSERFSHKRAEVDQDTFLTRDGKRAHLIDALRKDYGRDLRDARGPLDVFAKNIAAVRDAIKPVMIDRTDVVAAMERQELRAFIRGLPHAEKTALLLENPDARFLDAVLDAPAALSGVPPEIYGRAKQAREEQIHGPVLRELEAMESLLADAQNAATIARNDLMGMIEMDERSFDRIMLPIENKQHAPWLKREGESVVVIVPGESTALPATADQLRDGVYYDSAAQFFEAHGCKDQNEWAARRAA